MYIFGNEISEPVYFRHHYLDMYILGNEKLLDVYFRDKPRFSFTRTWNSEGFNYLAFIENWKRRSSQSNLIEAVRRGNRIV